LEESIFCNQRIWKKVGKIYVVVFFLISHFALLRPAMRNKRNLQKAEKELFIMILLLVLYFNSSQMLSVTNNYFRSHLILKLAVVSNCNSRMLSAVLLLVPSPV